jgi:hypothetical protein
MDEISEIETDPELLSKLLEASKRTLTADEIAMQRASFVFGQLPDDHPASKEDIHKYFSREKERRDHARDRALSELAAMDAKHILEGK